jgi:hypothetical protein
MSDNDNNDKNDSNDSRNKQAIKAASQSSLDNLFEVDEVSGDRDLDDLGLTPFEIKFVHYILKGYTKTDAAVKAGSTAKNPNKVGWNTFNRENVQEAIARASKIRLQALAIDTTYVVENLMEVVATGLAEKKLGDSVKALELLGKQLGMFHEAANKGVAKTKEDGLKSGNEKIDVNNDLKTFISTLPDNIFNKKSN